MPEAIEEITPIQPTERRGMLRPERREEAPDDDTSPTAPASHPHKGNILDVMA